MRHGRRGVPRRQPRAVGGGGDGMGPVSRGVPARRDGGFAVDARRRAAAAGAHRARARGRVGLAAWDGPEHNPWVSLMGKVMVERGIVEPEPPDLPGPFALGRRPGQIEELLDAAGFDDIEVEPLDLAFHAPDLDAWWDVAIRTSGRFSRIVANLSPAEHYALRDAIDDAYQPYVAADGSLEIPARAPVPAASPGGG